MKKKLLMFSALIFVALFCFATVHFAQAATDCDGNAVIYCGVPTISTLESKLEHGTGQPDQSAADLKALFAKYNISESDFSQLKNGRVTKTNKVYVGDIVVASNVYTMGRHDISGSTKISGLSYPLYKRHPSVSFLANSLDAYVYLNYDGTMRYAIIKSCGNIVIGVLHTSPKPLPPATVSLTVEKFDDANGNGALDDNESLLPGWNFQVSGPSFSEEVTTLNDGSVTLSGLKAGIYTVTEILQTGWKNTTGISVAKNVTTDPDTQVFLFGNQPVGTPVPPTGGGETKPLPSTGPVDWVLAGLVLVLLGAGLWWYRSKDMLRHAKHHKPADGKIRPKNPKKNSVKRK